MNEKEYARKYHWRVKRLKSLGLPYARKCFWYFGKVGKDKREIQLASMLATIRDLEAWKKEMASVRPVCLNTVNFRMGKYDNGIFPKITTKHIICGNMYKPD